MSSDKFFKPETTANGKAGNKKKEGKVQGEKFYTWAAAWQKVDKKGRTFLSVQSNVDDLKEMLEFYGIEFDPDTIPEEGIAYMVVRNINQRDDHNDPDYYMRPFMKQD